MTDNNNNLYLGIGCHVTMPLNGTCDFHDLWESQSWVEKTESSSKIPIFLSASHSHSPLKNGDFHGFSHFLHQSQMENGRGRTKPVQKHQFFEDLVI